MPWPTIPSHVCSWPMLNDVLRRLRHHMGRGGSGSGDVGCMFGLSAAQTLSTGALAAATAVAWDKIFPPNGDDEAREPSWLDSGFGESIKVKRDGVYLVSWSIDWSSTQNVYASPIEFDEAKTYLTVRSSRSGVEPTVGGASHAHEAKTKGTSLVYPVTPVQLRSGDSISSLVEKVAGDSSGNWTAGTDSWLSLVSVL